MSIQQENRKGSASMTDDATLIRDLSEADHLPEKVLRRALGEPEAIAADVLRLLDSAADGVDLEPAE